MRRYKEMYGQTTKKDIMTRVENLNDLTIHEAHANWSNWPKTITITIDGNATTYKTLREAYEALWNTDPYYEHKELETKAEEPEMKEEEETMKPTTKPNQFTFEGSTYYTNDKGTYFYCIKAGNTKADRIPKMIYDEAKELYDAAQTAEDAQAELDKEPCWVEVHSDLYKPAVFRKDCPGCVDCSECNVIGCVHRDCMRRNPKSEGGLGECPRLDVKPQQEEPDEVQDPELEQIMDETGLEPADAELERNIRHEHKKPSKPRRSKDIAYEGNGVTLTAKQMDFLRELRKTEAYKEDENDMVIEDVTITIGGQFEDKPMTVGAMISTLCEKHLGTRTKAKVGNRTMTLFGLTPSGKNVMDCIGGHRA